MLVHKKLDEFDCSLFAIAKDQKSQMMLKNYKMSIFSNNKYQNPILTYFQYVVFHSLVHILL